MTKETYKETLAQFVFKQIKEDIIYNKFKPGQKLCIADLKKKYEVGLSPLREALTQLSSLNFLECESMKGFRVPTISLESVQDAYRARRHIEPFMASLAVKNATEDDESLLVAAHHQLKKIENMTQKTEFTQWKEKHEKFVLSLMQASHSPTLISIQKNLYEQTERYRCLWFKWITENEYFKQMQIYSEYHQNLLDAFINRDDKNIQKIYKTKMTYWIKSLSEYLEKEINLD